MANVEGQDPKSDRSLDGMSSRNVARTRIDCYRLKRLLFSSNNRSHKVALRASCSVGLLLFTDLVEFLLPD